MIWPLYILFITGYAINHGFYTLSGILLLIIAFSLFIILYFFKPKNLYVGEKKYLPFVLFYSSLLSLVLYGGLYQQNYTLIIVSFFMETIILILTILFIFKLLGNRETKVYLLIFVIQILIRVFMIISSPSPRIDVYDYLKNGALALIHGQNPYSIHYHQFYPNVAHNIYGYGYLPSTLFVNIPFIFLFSDQRVGILFFEAATAYLLVKFVGGRTGIYLSLIYLSSPMAGYVLEESYIESIILFGLFAASVSYIRKQFIVSSIIFGLTLAMKQYVVLIIPFLWKLNDSLMKKLKFVFCIGLTSFIIMVPFILWNPNDFMNITLFAYNENLPRYEGLTIFSLLHQLVGIKYNFWIGWSIIIIFYVIIWRHTIKNNLSNIFLSYFLALFVFFLFYKWAFVDHLYFVGQLIILSEAMRSKNGLFV